MKEKLRTLFQQKFNPIEYRKVVLQNLLHAQQLLSQPQFLEETNDGDRIYGLGYLTDADGKQIGLYYTDVVNSDVRRKCVGFRQMMKKYTDFGVDAAIAVFADKEHWRLSYMSDLKGGETSAKRFSYILGDLNGQYNTPVNRLALLGTQAPRLQLKNIFEAFSVETLSDEFFDLYRDHYADIVEYLTGKRMVKVDNKWVEKVIHAPLQSVYEQLTGVENADKIVRDYVKKMMGRIVFLHFLQKKGWLNDDTNFMQHTFSRNESCQDDFLEKILEPLFFGFLNTRKEDRVKLFDKHPNWDKQLLAVWENIPYLNGGLFEQDEVDNLNIRLPRSMFDDLFTFLAEYNFTVDENDPDDAEVGVDPEMLGKIFESLLEDNKAKGAFYTPKEIVRYMCKESLIAYLDSKLETDDASERLNARSANNPTQGTQCGETNNRSECVSETRDLKIAIRAFVETHEMQPELEPYRDILDAALRNVKICDPAIGSGAFPMGLLNELWRCREALAIREANNLQDLQDLVSAASRSKLKKEIIENNIYGVDIERGAIDIARLRFWLSIVVDAEEPEPLPNFDYKFMQGNSLIESYKGIDLSRISNRLRGGQSKSTQLLLGLDSDFSKKNLQRLMRDYFSITDHKQKASMRQAINDEVKHLITDFIGGSAADLDKFDPSANQDFFLWHTWFKDIFDNGGFDIVIGNPPYGANIDSMIDEYNRLYPGVMNNIAEIYKLFFSLFITICRNNGFCILITPNTYLSQPRYKDLRTYLLKYKIVKIIDLSENVFDATVSTAVTLMSKSSNLCNIVYYDNKNNINLTAFESYPEYILDIESIKNSFDKSICIDLNPNISSKFLDEVFELKDAGIQYHRSNIGLKNKGGNDLYERIFSSDANHFQRCIPTWYGKKINRFYIDQDTDEYFNLDYRDVLKQNEFVSFNIKAFNQPLKIIWRQTASYITATLDAKQRWFRNTIQCGYLKPEYIESVDYYYALSIFNSRYFRECYNKLVRESGRVFPQIKLTHLRKLPFVIASFEKQNELSELAKEIVKIKQCNPNADTSELEHQIDILVYKLYNLTPEEIAIIEQ